MLSWLLPAGTKRRSFKATKPLKLPLKTPPCFDSQAHWGIYRVLAQTSAGNGFTYCTDCTPEYRDKMRAEGRCKFPSTTFIKTNGVIVGKRET